MGTVLVVDDTAEIADLVIEILSDAGYAAMHAGTYDEAARVVADHDVSLVLLDTMGDAATELLPRIAQSQPPIVLFSAWSGIEERARAIGAQGWLAKPFAIDELVETVKTHARDGCHVDATRTN